MDTSERKQAVRSAAEKGMEKAAEVIEEIETELSAEAYSELLAIRRDKLQALKDANDDPFVRTGYPQDAYAADIKANFTEVPEGEHGPTVCMAGRMMSKRVMGKASFADLRDHTGDIQMYIRRDILGEDVYAGFKKFDIGDVVGIKGEVFRTHMGEI
ncbi:MAG: OB-fold nucleic acid binding domain-containing protein, partial [Ruthenibacterium sp.]